MVGYLFELARAAAQIMRAPERPHKVSIDQIVKALEDVDRSPLSEYKSATIETVARLHSPTPFGYSRHHFRTAIMFEPGQAFGLAKELSCPALDHICRIRPLGVVTLDIREITCLSASKGPLSNSVTLDDFALAECRDEIGSADIIRLEACLRHPGVRLASPFRDNGDGLEGVSWTGGTIYWPNYDGSHHFSAARYIAGLLNIEVPITANTTLYSLSEDALIRLSRDYHVWVMPDHDKTWIVIRLIHQHGVAIGVAGMPLPYRDDLLVLLPRRFSGVTAIAGLIAASGATPFSVFTEHWLSQQDRAIATMPTWFSD